MRKSATSNHVPIEEMDFFALYEEVAEWAWAAFESWPPGHQDTIGKQLVRAADSVGANLVEGDGRFGAADAIHFFVMARASAREARLWIKRCMSRQLVSADDARGQIEKLSKATRLLNLFINYRRRAQKPPSGAVKEDRTAYAGDPFVGEA